MELSFAELLERVIQKESSGNPNAVNPVTGASGLMQIMPDTARQPGYGVAPMDWDRRFDAAENRRFGEQYLMAMLNQYDGDQARALAAYNWGPGNANRWDGDMASLPAETRDYINVILTGGAPVGARGSAPARPQIPTGPDAPPPNPAMLPAMQPAPVMAAMRPVARPQMGAAPGASMRPVARPQNVAQQVDLASLLNEITSATQQVATR
jgi:hypothetical protein